METGAVYSDFGHLASLKAEAAANPNAAIEDVASQFESIFIQMMLKSMRDATVKGDLFNSNQLDTYMAMADQQVALSLSENGGIGIARMLVEQLQSKGYVPPAGAAEGGADATKTSSGVENTVMSVTQTGSLISGTAAGAKVFELPAADTSTKKWEG